MSHQMPLTFDATSGSLPCAKTDPLDARWTYPTLDLQRPASDEDIAYLTVGRELVSADKIQAAVYAS